VTARVPTTTGSVTPARRVAYAVIRRVFEQGAYADRALHGEARGLDSRERGLAMQLAYGTVQRKLSLDYVIEQLARPVDELDPPTLAALRLGLYQLAYLDNAAPHAVVGESVELAKGKQGGHGLVNAVLRRALRDGMPRLPSDDTPQGAAIAHSYPLWLVELWWERFGPGDTRALLRAGNQPGELALRVNTLRTTPAAVAAALDQPARPAGDELPEGLVVEGAFDAHAHPLYRAGAYVTQSRGAMLVARALDPRPGERVLDLCAAPGG
jgi:16S rRNA (cytosine967-C5)-methyltransferase